MSTLRLLVVGGYLSFRALFGWLNPSMYLMTMLIPSITTLAFFVYLGRTAHAASDAVYVSGNALLAAAAPALWGMAQAISGERYAQTLGLLVASPASPTVIFLGRAVPATVNGLVVSAWTFAVGRLLFGLHVPSPAIAPIALTVVATAFSCVGLGLINAALGLRWRETAVLGNVFLFILLLFAGVNIPLDRLPGWLSTSAQALPVTHAAEAVRELISGAPFSHVWTLIAAEFLIGATYALLGLLALGFFERAARQRATLDLT